MRERQELDVSKDSGAFYGEIGKPGKGSDLGWKMLSLVMEC